MTRWLLLSAALLAACAPRATLRTRGLSEAITTESALRETLAPRRVALLFGIDRYDDPAFPDLSHAADDAASLAEVLRAPDSGFDEVVLLADTDGVTRSEVFEALRRASVTLRRDDELVLYFAGHGARDPLVNDGHRFLLTTDARPTSLPATAIDLEALLEYALALPPLRVGVIVDACFDGGGRSVGPDSRGAGAPPEVPLVRDARLGPGHVQAFATTPGRPSLEDDSLGHGVYTWYLLEALGWGFREADRDRDGVLTLWEAHDHARGKVIEHTEGAQVPEAILRTVGEADVVLRGSSDARRSRDAALLYLYPAPSDRLGGTSIRIDGRTRGSLPGTIAVEPGRHELTVVDADGDVLTTGAVDLARGRAYRVDELLTRVESRRGEVGLAATVVAAPPLAPALGPAAVGVAIDAAFRVAPTRLDGLYLGAHLTLPWAPGTGAGTARPLVGGGASVGWLDEHRALRWRAAWGVGGWGLPPRIDATAPALTDPAAAGWRFVTTGPRLTIGARIARTWSVDVDLAVDGTGLRLTPQGPVRFVPLVQASLGARAAF